jgi:prolyl oligopeptidase
VGTVRRHRPARRGADVDVLHGERIADPYRWLEHLSAPETRSWVRAQDDLTRTQLSGDAYQRFRTRIERLGSVRRFTVPVRRGDRWFFFETDANGLSGRKLMIKDGPASPRTIVLPASDSIAGTLSPTPDGQRLAYAERLDGSRTRHSSGISRRLGHESGGSFLSPIELQEIERDSAE